MLQALLSSAGLTSNDVSIRDYPDYGQGVALQQGQVESATGFRNNEPVQLAQSGFATTQLTIDEIVPLPGPGLIVGTTTLTSKHDALKAFVAATLRAMDEIRVNPQAGLDDSIAVVPELGEQQGDCNSRSSRRPSRCGQIRTLRRTGRVQSTATRGRDRSSSCAAWPIRIFLRALTVDQLVTEELLQ